MVAVSSQARASGVRSGRRGGVGRSGKVHLLVCLPERYAAGIRAPDRGTWDEAGGGAGLRGGERGSGTRTGGECRAQELQGAAGDLGCVERATLDLDRDEAAVALRGEFGEERREIHLPRGRIRGADGHRAACPRSARSRDAGRHVARQSSTGASSTQWAWPMSRVMPNRSCPPRSSLNLRHRSTVSTNMYGSGSKPSVMSNSVAVSSTAAQPAARRFQARSSARPAGGGPLHTWTVGDPRSAAIRIARRRRSTRRSVPASDMRVGTCLCQGSRR